MLHTTRRSGAFGQKLCSRKVTFSPHYSLGVFPGPQGAVRIKPHIQRGPIQVNACPVGIFFKAQISHSGEDQKEVWYRFVQRLTSSLTSALTARFDTVVTIFAAGKIDEDTGDYMQFVAFEGSSHENNCSSCNPGQLTKRIHGESNELGQKEALQTQLKNQQRQATFYLEGPLGLPSTLNRPLSEVLLLFGGGGGLKDLFLVVKTIY